MQRRRLTRRQEKRRRAIKEGAGCIVAGLVLGGLVIAGFMFDPYEPPSPPEHYGQIEYCGRWWDIDDYNQMMAERQAYLDAEAAEERKIVESIREYQAKAESGTYQTDQISKDESENGTLIYSMDWDAEESEMLARIAMAEAEGEDTEGKALVILVVLNRVWSDGFPDTIEGVITQKRQFTAYENGRYDRLTPNEDCYKALELVQVQHWDESRGATYFESKDSESEWHRNNLEKLYTHGNHIFYKEQEQ